MAGLSLGLLYVLKYSGVFVALGGLAYIGIQCVTGRRWGRACLCAFAFLVPIIGVNFINQLHAHTMNLITASRSFGLRPEILLFAIANPALAVASGEAALRYVLLRPTTGLLPGGSELWLGLAGLPGGVTLLILLSRRTPFGAHAILACCVFSVSIICVMAVWTLSNAVSFEARHIAGGSLAVLPYVIEIAYGLRASRRGRVFLAVCGIFYIILPSLYGVAATVGKTIRHSRHHPGPSDIYDPFLSPDSARSRSILTQDFDPSSDVWYLMHPIAALDLPGRMLIRRADDISIENLRRESYQTRKPVRVRVVLPATPEMDEKSVAIRESFSQAAKWTSCPSDSSVHCWVSWIATSRPIDTKREALAPFIIVK